MRVSSIISAVALSSGLVLADVPTGQLGNATAVANNPMGFVAVGALPEKPFWTAGSINGNVKGSLTVKSSASGVGVDYVATFSNLPTEGGPFLYHIHAKSVPANGNCTATMAHLDPFVRGEDPTCNSTYPETCQVGDLSGKYGKITSDPFQATYHDQFGSLVLGSNASIEDRSFVVHFANKTRITCANFTVQSYGSNVSYPTTTGGLTSPTYTGVPVTAAASALNVRNLLQGLVAIPVAALLLI